MACPDDWVSRFVLHVLHVFVLPLSALPNLDLATTTDDTNPHRGEQVVSRVRMEVNTAIEHGGSILAEATPDERLASRVLVDEVGHVMDDASNSNETTAIVDLLNIIVPLNDGKLVKRNPPVELGTLLVEFLLELLDAALLNLVGAELLEVIGKAELAPGPNAPLGWVVLVPLDGVAVVGRKLVVEIVVSLAESNESGDDVIPWAVAVIEGLVTEPVGKRVDAEGSLLDEEDAEDAGIDVATDPVSPPNTGHKSWEDQAHEEDDLEIVAMLPDNDRIFVQIGDVRTANSFWVLLHDHPANVAVKQSLANAVGVLGGISVTMMGTVVAAPPADRTFNGTATNACEEKLQRERGRVRLVCPETMVSGRDS